MEIISKEEFMENEIYKDRVRNGDIFVYPTDTIYGIGCNALISESVKKIRKIKKRDKHPFSVIAPSKKWIKENLIIKDEKILEKLPGAYTLIFRVRKQSVVEEVNPEINTLGVRIPNHWISDFVKKLGTPIITTSVNKAGEKPMTSIENLDKDIKDSVNFIVYEGVKDNKPSTIIDLTNKKIIKR